MASQKQNGNAFEWAVGAELTKALQASIVNNDAFIVNQAAFQSVSAKNKNHFIKAAKAAVAHILVLENLTVNKAASIEFNTDKAGQSGDVRDIILKIENREIGISCKTNHDALKHSRLSDSLDFVEKWGLDSKGCSQTYWQAVKPIFAAMRSKADRVTKWEIHFKDKANQIYWPILNAFQAELQRLAQGADEKKLCKNLISYLIGAQDFYKVIARPTQVEIQAFNFQNSLKAAASKYPTAINTINDKNGGQYSKTITFNAGYAINFRIHTASSKIEPSLKFDITAIGLPQKSIYQHHITL